MDVKCPNVSVQLTGVNGNAFSIVGTVVQAMRRAGVDKGVQKEYQDEALSGDYDNVLQTTMRYVHTS